MLVAGRPSRSGPRPAGSQRARHASAVSRDPDLFIEVEAPSVPQAFPSETTG